MAILGLQNPVLIAGFDILFFGKGGFSSLARANRVKVRTKGSGEPWVELKFTWRHKLKAQKEFALYKLLQKLSFRRDIKKKVRAKKPVIKSKKKPEPVKKSRKSKKLPKIEAPTKEEVLELRKLREPKLASKIKFKQVDEIPKVIRTKRDQYIEIRKTHFLLEREINFANANTFDAAVVNQFLMGAKEQFKKLFLEMGKGDYYIRMLHEYADMPNYYKCYPDQLPKGKSIRDVADKTFSGLSIHRMRFNSLNDIEDQFNFTLTRKYIMSFSSYLNFASASTFFNFSGFMVERTKKIVDK